MYLCKVIIKHFLFVPCNQARENYETEYFPFFGNFQSKQDA